MCECVGSSRHGLKWETSGRTQMDMVGVGNEQSGSKGHSRETGCWAQNSVVDTGRAVVLKWTQLGQRQAARLEWTQLDGQ